MKTREEEIKQNAEAYADKKAETVANFQRNPIVEDFIAGAHSRDEEIKQLRNPWRDAKTELPDDEQLCIVWIKDAVYGLFCNVCRYFASIGFVIARGEVEYWMSIPESPNNN